MPVQLPFDAVDPIYRIGITLNDTPYIADVRWNARDNAWYFDLYDTTESAIVLGTKLVLGGPLLARCTDPRKPSGLLLVADTSGEGRDAGIDDLGSRVVVFHYTVAELDDLEA